MHTFIRVRCIEQYLLNIDVHIILNQYRKEIYKWLTIGYRPRPLSYMHTPLYMGFLTRIVWNKPNIIIFVIIIIIIKIIIIIIIIIKILLIIIKILIILIIIIIYAFVPIAIESHAWNILANLL